MFMWMFGNEPPGIST